jgi:hypothetical protein
MFTAMQNLRIERGTVNTALETMAVADDETRSDIAALREHSETALASAIAKFAPAGLVGMERGLDGIRVAHEAFAALRRDVDTALGQRKDLRPRDLSARWVASNGKLVDAIDVLSELISSDLNQADPFITEMMEVKQLAWMLRDAAGFDRLMVGAALANGGRLTAELQQQLAFQSGRIDFAWKAIEDDTRAATTPRPLTNAVATRRRLMIWLLASRRRSRAGFGSSFRTRPLPASWTLQIPLSI